MTAPEDQNGLHEALARVSVLAAFPGLKDRIIAAFGRAAWVDNPGISVHGSADGGRIAMNHSGWAALPALLDEALAPVASLIAERDAAVADMKAAEAQNDALHVKLAALAPHGTCACSYDRRGDVCAHHSPALRAAEAEITRLKEGMEAAVGALHTVADRCELARSVYATEQTATPNRVAEAFAIIRDTANRTLATLSPKEQP